MAFKDHFSELSDLYRQYRPTYPESLFSYLSSLAPNHDCAWDCATGNGQSAVKLAGYFRQVLATDASSEQISQAISHPQVSYMVATAEKALIKNSSVDLITVAQALHWFDTDAFFLEADRTLKPGGILAVWSYKLLSISPMIDEVVNHFYTCILAGYWPAERQWIDEDYQSVIFPYSATVTKAFNIQETWNLEQLLGYLSTWSAVKRYQSVNNINPLHELSQSLQPLWREKSLKMPVTWPLNLVLCMKPA